MRLKPVLSLRNNVAAFGWGVAILFLCACSAFTYILIRDGAGGIQVYPPDIPEYYPAWFFPAVLAAFWVAGVKSLAHFANIPCVRMTVLGDGTVVVRKRYLLRTDVSCQAGSTYTVSLIREEGGDGEFYYRVQLDGDSGPPLIVAEGSDIAHCQSICDRLEKCIGR